MNAGWIEHTGGDFLFYREGITESVGRVTAAVNSERMAIARALGLPAITFLEAFYRAGLPPRRRATVVRSPALAGRASPTVRSNRRRRSITVTSTKTLAMGWFRSWRSASSRE